MKNETIHGRLTAIQHLIEHSEYHDEWSGAGMWEAVEEIMKSGSTTFLKTYIDELLKKAANF